MTTAMTDRIRPQRRAAATMRAAVMTGPGEIRIDEIAVPAVGPGEVRVRLNGCGVCASNLAPWSGPDWMRFPLPPGDLGHEGWGVVDAVGAGVHDLKEGDPVATLFHRSYADYDVGPAEAVVRLPPALAGVAFPGEPLACAVNIFRRSAIETGQTVAVVGSGFIGALLVRLTSLAGAQVIALSRRPFARETATRMGAGHTVALEGDRQEIVERVAAITGGGLCERVVEATGKQDPLDIAGDLTGERGRLIIAGYHQDGPRRIYMQQWNWRGIDVINAHERDPAVYLHGLRAAIRRVEAGQIDLAPLLTHTYPLEHLAEALDATRDRPEGFLKATVSMA